MKMHCIVSQWITRCYTDEVTKVLTDKGIVPFKAILKDNPHNFKIGLNRANLKKYKKMKVSSKEDRK